MDMPQAGSVAEGFRPRPRRAERGQTLVVAAVMIVVLVAFLGLVIDGGNVYAQRRQLQNAADAAALAGARALALNKGSGRATTDAAHYARTNGAQDCTVTTEADAVTVVVTSGVGTFFASVVGVNNITVSAAARAGYCALQSTEGERVFPATIAFDKWSEGQLVTIWDKDPGSPQFGDIYGQSQRGWLNLDGGSVGQNNKTRCWICGGSCDVPAVWLDAWVNATPGTRDTLIQTVEECYVKDETVVLVPLFDQVTQNNDHPRGPHDINGVGTVDYHIVAFGAFRYDSAAHRGPNKYIKGRFISYVYGHKPYDDEHKDSPARVVRLLPLDE